MRRLLALPVFAALIIAGRGDATPTWTVPSVISDAAADGRALGPELAVNRSGGAIAVWDRETGPDCAESPASLSCVHTVEAAYRTGSGSSWDSRRPIARPGVGARPTAGIDDVGDAALLWVHDIGLYRVVQATLRHGPDGEFPNPNDLSDAVLEVRSHHIALDGAGDAVAVWAQRPLNRFEVHAEIRQANFGVWGVAVLFSVDAVTGGPSLSVTPGGEAFVVWVESGVVKGVRGDLPSATWERPVVLSSASGEAGGDPVVAVNSAGDAVAVWQWRERPNGQTIVQSAFRPSGSTWRPPTDIAGAGTGFTHDPRAAIDAAGNAVAVWVAGAGTLPLQSAAWARDSGAWSRAVDVVPVGASDPDLAVDSRGDAVAVWTDAMTKTTNAAIRPVAAGAWQPAAALSGHDAFDARVEMDAAGNAAATWDASIGKKVDVQSVDLRGDWQPTLANRSRPVVRGTARVGRTLVCERGSWDATVPIAYAYGWLRNGRRLRAVNQPRYRVRPGDGGSLVACRVVATNPAGTLAVSSRAVRVRRG